MSSQDTLPIRQFVPLVNGNADLVDPAPSPGMMLQAIRKTKGPALGDRLVDLLPDSCDVGGMVEFSEAHLILKKVYPREASEFFDAALMNSMVYRASFLQDTRCHEGFLPKTGIFSRFPAVLHLLACVQ
jgi:hypothetical protein